MGMFDFIKDAGQKLFGKDDAALSSELNELVTKSSLNVSSVRVSCEDGTACVTGEVDSQALREKVVLMVGNTSGVAKVDDRMAVKKPEPEATFYTVKSGDTLSKIAKSHYGDPMKYNSIFDANKPMLSDPDKIYPGQVLRIPQAQA